MGVDNIRLALGHYKFALVHSELKGINLDDDLSLLFIAAFKTKNMNIVQLILDDLLTKAAEDSHHNRTIAIALEEARDQCRVSEEIEELIAPYLPQDSDDEEKMQDADDCLNYQEIHKEKLAMDLLAAEGSEYTQTEGQIDNADNFSPTQIGECEEQTDSS